MRLKNAGMFSLIFGMLAPATPAAQAPPQLTLRENLRLGQGLTHEVIFSRVVAIVPRLDGSFHVTDSGEKSIRLFGNDGRLLKVIGRDGSGPGEFRALESAGSRADTLWAMDPQLRRVSLLSPEGEFLRGLDAAVVGGSQRALQAVVADALIAQTRPS